MFGFIVKGGGGMGGYGGMSGGGGMGGGGWGSSGGMMGGGGTVINMTIG